MPPLVSILIPAHNAEPYLADTLRSALAQTWPAKEVLVVEDGSADGTLEVARSFEAAGVRVLHQENAGAAAARNRAFRESQGDWIQFLDADDLLHPDKITAQVRRLREEGPQVVAGARWGRFQDDPALARFLPESFWRDESPVDWLVACWQRYSMMHPAAWLLPRPLAEKAGPWDESLSLDDDGEYFTRVVLASRRICFCPDAVSYYRSCLPASLSGSRSVRAWDSAFRSLEAKASLLLAAEDSQRTRRACARLYQEFRFAAYPDCPDLIDRAQRRLRELGVGTLPVSGGRAFRTVSAVVGWKVARRLQRWRERWFPRRPAVPSV